MAPLGDSSETVPWAWVATALLMRSVEVAGAVRPVLVGLAG